MLLQWSVKVKKKIITVKIKGLEFYFWRSIFRNIFQYIILWISFDVLSLDKLH